MHSVEELYRTYEKPIFRYFYGLTTSYHNAEELTQETFLQVVRSMPYFKGNAQVTTWLYKVARNVFTMWRRKQDNHSLSLDCQEIEIPDHQEPAVISEQKEKLNLLLRTLRQLPENYREVLAQGVAGIKL